MQAMKVARVSRQDRGPLDSTASSTTAASSIIVSSGRRPQVWTLGATRTAWIGNDQSPRPGEPSEEPCHRRVVPVEFDIGCIAREVKRDQEPPRPGLGRPASLIRSKRTESQAAPRPNIFCAPRNTQTLRSAFPWGRGGLDDRLAVRRRLSVCPATGGDAETADPMHVEAALRAVRHPGLELAFEIGLHLQQFEPKPACQADRERGHVGQVLQSTDPAERPVYGRFETYRRTEPKGGNDERQGRNTAGA